MLDKMRILRVFSRDDSHELAAIACRVAILCYSLLPPDIVCRAGAMRPSELRGYLRAHLNHTLARQTDIVGRQMRLSKRKLPALIELVLDQLSELCERRAGRVAA